MTREMLITTHLSTFRDRVEARMEVGIEPTKSPFETKHLNPHITASFLDKGRVSVQPQLPLEYDIPSPEVDYQVPTYYNPYTFQPTELPELKALLAKDECKFLLRNIRPDANVVEECRWLMNYGMEHPNEFINNEYIRVWNGENSQLFGEDYGVLLEEHGYTFPIPYSFAHHAIRNAHLYYGGSYHNRPSKSYQPKMTAKQQLFKDLGFIVPPKKP